MSQLIIDDLNFFESEPSNSELKGGLTLTLPKVSTAVDTGVDTALKTKLTIIDGTVSYAVGNAAATGRASALDFNRLAQAKVNVKAEVKVK